MHKPPARTVNPDVATTINIGKGKPCPLTRRDFLAAGGALAATLSTNWLPRLDAADARRPKVAAIFTEFRFRSHAYNILENFFRPYLFRGQLVAPGVDVVAFYADQF